MRRLLAFVTVLVCCPTVPALAGQISVALEAQMQALDEQEEIKVLVVCEEQGDIATLDHRLRESRAPLSVRHQQVIDTLREVAERTQADLIEDLSASQYPGIRGFVKLEPGRYRFSFCYRTVGRERPVTVNILKLIKDIDADRLTTVETVRQVSAGNDNFLKFLQNVYPPTNGEWRQVSTFLEVDEPRSFCVMFEPFFMEKGGQAWIDDATLRRVW